MVKQRVVTWKLTDYDNRLNEYVEPGWTVTQLRPVAVPGDRPYTVICAVLEKEVPEPVNVNERLRDAVLSAISFASWIPADDGPVRKRAGELIKELRAALPENQENKSNGGS